MLRIHRKGVTRVLRAWVAPFLILFAPFLSYVQYHRHGLQHPDVAVFALLLAVVALVLAAGAARWPLFNVVILAGLLTFLVDIQAKEPGLKRLGLLFLALALVLWLLRRHASYVVSAAMLTVVASLVLFPERFDGTRRGPGPLSGGGGHPLVVHVLMDEMIGVGGLPADLAPPGFRERMQSFFVERGFRLFGHAYSQHVDTYYSVPQFLNLSNSEPEGLVAPGPSDGTFRLTRNEYFERFARLGYAIKVHEPDYLYLCPEDLPASCRTYASRSLNLLDSLDMPLTAKLSVVAGTFLGQSETYTRFKTRYRKTRRRLAGVLPLPAWSWDRGLPTTASSLEMFEAASEDLAKARAGTLVFVHVLLPHFPYVYDGNCTPRPVGEWLERWDSEASPGTANTPQGRAARYAAYLQQMACGERQIDRLLDSIPAALRRDAIVIVQGDHGSRIALVDPSARSREAMVPSDFADSYSTTFAVRSPWIAADYDAEPASIACLLRSLVDSDFRSTAAAAACSSRTVYLQAEEGPPEAHRLPDFTTVTRGAAAPVPTTGTTGTGFQKGEAP